VKGDAELDARAEGYARGGLRWQLAKDGNLIWHTVGEQIFLFCQIFKDGNLVWQTVGVVQYMACTLGGGSPSLDIILLNNNVVRATCQQ
jgi:hypothetical protein